MNILRDFLSNHPARPQTKVPGHWLLPLTPNPQIHIRRLQASTSSHETSGTILEKLRDDPLEKAWRQLNGTKGDEGILTEGCATIVYREDGDENRKQLWCFVLEDRTAEDFPTFEVLEGTFSSTSV